VKSVIECVRSVRFREKRELLAGAVVTRVNRRPPGAELGGRLPILLLELALTRSIFSGGTKNLARSDMNFWGM